VTTSTAVRRGPLGKVNDAVEGAFTWGAPMSPVGPRIGTTRIGVVMARCYPRFPTCEPLDAAAALFPRLSPEGGVSRIAIGLGVILGCVPARAQAQRPSESVR